MAFVLVNKTISQKWVPSMKKIIRVNRGQTLNLCTNILEHRQRVFSWAMIMFSILCAFLNRDIVDTWCAIKFLYQLFKRSQQWKGHRFKSQQHQEKFTWLQISWTISQDNFYLLPYPNVFFKNLTFPYTVQQPRNECFTISSMHFIIWFCDFFFS